MVNPSMRRQIGSHSPTRERLVLIKDLLEHKAARKKKNRIDVFPCRDCQGYVLPLIHSTWKGWQFRAVPSYLTGTRWKIWVTWLYPKGIGAQLACHSFPWEGRMNGWHVLFWVGQALWAQMVPLWVIMRKCNKKILLWDAVQLLVRVLPDWFLPHCSSVRCLTLQAKLSF